MNLRIGSLFTGYGGLEMGVQQVLGATVAWHAEIDPGANRVLAHHWPHVPNLGDVSTVDWRPEHCVDLLCGGFPCQDVSHAGKRAGLAPGTRSGLWAEFARAIAALRPPLVLIENVRGLLSAPAERSPDATPLPVGPHYGDVGDDRDGPVLRAMGAVLGDLADLRYDARWCGVRAADAGAPHGRFRVFILAWPAGNASNPWRISDGDDDPAADARGKTVRVGAGLRPSGPTGGGGRRPGDRRASHAAADAGSVGRNRRAGVVGGRRATAVGDEAGDHAGDGHSAPAAETTWGPYAAAVARWERTLGRVAPPPTERGRNGQPRLSPRFVEWLMGLPDGHVTGVPGVGRNQQLKALGNGVVPQQAALALRWLLAGEWAAVGPVTGLIGTTPHAGLGTSGGRRSADYAAGRTPDPAEFARLLAGDAS